MTCSVSPRHAPCLGSWHENECKSPDVRLIEGSPVCISCGSIYTRSEENLNRGELGVSSSTPGIEPVRTKLKLDWPATITFSSSATVENKIVRTALDGFQKLIAEQRTWSLAEANLGEVIEDSPIVRPNSIQEKSSGRKEGLEDIKKHQLLRNHASPIYQPLRSQDQVRLLYISPSSSGSSQVLHGTLVPTHLSQLPEFTALSYTWADATGDRSRRETIFIGRQWEPLPITTNCAAALRRLRSPHDARGVWIDAICIDQANTGERGHQVGLMRDLYSRARQVVIFLGEADGRSAEGRLMAWMDEESFYKGRASRIEWEPDRDLPALRALFDRPYWRRIWVIQEVLLAREALVVLGGSSVPLASILRGRMARRTDTTSLFPSWTSIAGHSAMGDVDSFSELLVRTVRCQASDGRDKVFALLSLVQGAHLEGLVADYTKSPQEIYTGIAAYFLIRHGQANILKWASLSKGELSWVPTWDYELGGNTLSQALQGTTAHMRAQLLQFPGNGWMSWSEAVRPDHWCRASDTGPQRVADVVQILQPRVFQSTGALLIRAYPVMRLTAEVTKRAFHKESFTSNTVFRPAPGSDLPEGGLRWGIHVKWTSLWSRTSEEAWIVEVPNCDVYLQLTPHRSVPELYVVASACHMALFASADLGLLTAREGQGGGRFEDHLLLLRLLLFEPGQLLFLQSWEELWESHGFLRPSRAPQVRLSALDLMQYSRWVEHVQAHPKSAIGPSSDGATSDFGSSLRAVCIYLDGWADPALWDNISKVIEDVEWHSYVATLEELRRQATTGQSAPPPTSLAAAAAAAAAMDKSVDSRLEEMLDELMSAVDRLGVPGLTGGTARLGAFPLAQAADRLLPRRGGEATEDGRPPGICSWGRFASLLRYMRDARAGLEDVRNKFVQHGVLRRIYTRAEPREFLIG